MKFPLTHVFYFANLLTYDLNGTALSNSYESRCSLWSFVGEGAQKGFIFLRFRSSQSSFSKTLFAFRNPHPLNLFCGFMSRSCLIMRMLGRSVKSAGNRIPSTLSRYW